MNAHEVYANKKITMTVQGAAAEVRTEDLQITRKGGYFTRPPGTTNSSGLSVNITDKKISIL
jgi:hypothetical protein